ncbi:MAG: Ldh family oxidoreductase [Syntrophales bacterium LBB04]|nr:Ldh family oxidoreductase [Syntrophales bacterium LBB04]
MYITHWIRHEALVSAIYRALAAAGVPASICAVEADVMAEADLLGVPSHGIRMLPLLIRALRDGRAKANPQVQVLREKPAACLMDGDNGPGRYVSMRSMQQAVERARQYGIGACLAMRVTHWGRAHAYVARAALQGCIGICTTNAIPNMLGWNSGNPLLGNNPLAIGVPRGASKDPIILDMAMSQAAVGKLGTAAREGKSVPSHWGLDGKGNPTSDPRAILSSKRLLSFGDHKGVGLAVMMELLTGVLSGGMFSQELARMDGSGLDAESSKLFMALDITSFIEMERLEQRIDEYIACLRQMEPRLEITMPGERGWAVRDQYLREGIPIHEEILSQLKDIGVEF